MYKLAAFDIDGTLSIMKKHVIPQSAYNALDQLKKENIKIVLASGRSLNVIDKELLDFEFDYYVCANGGYVLDKQKKVIITNPIDLSISQSIIRYFKGINSTLVLRFPEGSLEVCAIEQLSEFRKVYFKKGYKHQPSLPIEYINDSPISGLCRMPSDKLNEIKSLYPSLSFYDALNGEFFDFQRCDVNKGSAIQQICQLNNISVVETIAFGDSYNDIEMLKIVGCGVAMGNALDCIKQHADYVTDDVEKDGLAKAINKLIFNM